MVRKYYTAAQILKIWPGNRALVLESPTGQKLLWKMSDPAPTSKWCVVGVID